MDGADSPAAAGLSDRAKAVALLKPLPGWWRLRLQTLVASALNDFRFLPEQPEQPEKSGNNSTKNGRTSRVTCSDQHT